MDVTKVAQDVQAWILRQPLSTGKDLTAVEAAVLPIMRMIGAKVVEALMAGQRLGYEGSSRPCTCGGRQKFLGHRSKTVLTLMGSVELKRAYYFCPGCGASSIPHDEQAGLDEGGFSVALVQQATLLGAHLPFALSHQMLQSLTGQRVPARTIERLVHRVGTVAARKEAEALERIKTWNAPPADLLPDDQRPKTLYIAADGAMVNRLDAWHEVKNAVVYWDDVKNRRHVRYVSRNESAEQFKAFVWWLACRCGLQTAERVVLIGDAAKWIWDHVASVFDEKTILIVDWYHAIEHLWACGRNFHQEGSAELKAWVDPLKNLLWNGDVRAVLQHLQVQRKATRQRARREALDALIIYLTNQDDRLAYNRFRAMELDIGSGMVEAACKHVVAVRMKRNGMRWSESGSQATLSLRVIHLNEQWDTFWSQKPLLKAA